MPSPYLNDDNDQLYVKIGRRYYPVARFEGFPADGVWLVESEEGSQRLVTSITLTKLGELPDPLPVVQIERHRDVISRAVQARWDVLREALYDQKVAEVSINEVVDTIIEAIADAERERNVRKALKEILQER